MKLIRQLKRTKLAHQFYRMKLRMATKIIRHFGRKYDIVSISTRALEDNFYQIDYEKIKSILHDKRLVVFDIGARDGINSGLKKYHNLLDIYLSEPDPEEAIRLEQKGYVVIKDLIGEGNGEATLNLCKKGGVSSVLEPNGTFLDFYARGDISRFRVMKSIKLETTSISKIFNNSRTHLDYLKIDVQGYENKVLAGMGDVRPLIIETEISFVPLYTDSTIFFELGKALYDMGYILFHVAYGNNNVYGKYLTNESYYKNKIPIHGDAWFMPDWTRKEGVNIIRERVDQWNALMLMFGMEDIVNYARSKINYET